MRLKITKTNFTNAFDWLFTLADESGNVFYIMEHLFYKKHNLINPITRKELDTYDKGQWITAFIKEIDGVKTVIRIA
ncbi:hypothetical protein [Hymenobacter sp. BT491]|uniref:hypothetical protein n=1 Tax=Hymenobacter sp. BT491 TaxID=2766779 RepID=UPI001653A961|nr:hypothetical protein [Hymenobacter sp. BT491]MBC6990146.1 hypothetical protein [Hymenobacter sp. BT491]